MMQASAQVLEQYSLLTALALVGAVTLVSYWAAERLTRGRLHGAALAVFSGLLLAALGGWLTGGKRGLADLSVFSGLGLLGGAMLRDLAIVATAYGVRLEEFLKGGASGALALAVGLGASFACGGAIAWACGYRDAESIATIGGGAATYIVGPVTGAAVGASSEIIALSVAAGLVKAVAVMIATPFAARWMGLDCPRAAMIFGGVLGTNSGVMAGLAATNPKLVPYGAATATFYTGLGCLLGPSLFYFIIRLLV